LDLDQCDDWPAISVQTFSSKDAVQNQKQRIRCAEWAFYRLFEKWDSVKTRDKLQPFFPPLESLQSLHLRTALFRWVNELKKNGTLGKDVTVRKTLFDDCKGDRFQELLAAFSVVVLKEALASEKTGVTSVVGRLCLADGLPKKEQASLLPLAIAHCASLKALLRKKKKLRARYSDFDSILDVENKELNRKFDTIVDTQGFLDQNVASEATVSRVAKLLNEHWQGDRRLIDVIAQGEELNAKHELLDVPFTELWSAVGDGRFTGDNTTTHSGMIADLERRVTAQNDRLHHWKEFRQDLQKHANDRLGTKKHGLFSPRAKSAGLDLRKEKDLVFSPRKSPRKSERPISPISSVDAGTDGEVAKFGEDNSHLPSTPTPNPPGMGAEVGSIKTGRQSLEANSQTGNDGDSDFFEIDDGDITPQFPGLSSHNSNSFASAVPSKRLDPDEAKQLEPNKHPPASTTSPAHASSTRPKAETFDSENNPTSSHDLAEQILASTFNAPSTPRNALTTLSDRTRKSMAFTNQTPPRIQTASIPTSSPQPKFSITEPGHITKADAKATLLDRTRQSISLVPSKPKPKNSRTSQISKVYPRNQFETPIKGVYEDTIQEVTPPEQLFSPGAGYESVFKSRPKVGFSPVSSPPSEVDGDHGDGEDGNGDGGRDEWAHSPSVRRLPGAKTLAE